MGGFFGGGDGKNSHSHSKKSREVLFWEERKEGQKEGKDYSHCSVKKRPREKTTKRDKPTNFGGTKQVGRREGLRKD